MEHDLSLRQMYGMMAKKDSPGSAILGYRIKFGKLWAGRWNHECSHDGNTVLAVTVHAPQERRTLSLDDWMSEHKVDGDAAI